MPKNTTGGEQTLTGSGGMVRDTRITSDPSVVLGTLAQIGQWLYLSDPSVILGTLVAHAFTAKSPSDPSVVLGTLTQRNTTKSPSDPSVILGTLRFGTVKPTDASVVLGQLRATSGGKILKLWTVAAKPDSSVWGVN